MGSVFPDSVENGEVSFCIFCVRETKTFGDTELCSTTCREIGQEGTAASCFLVRLANQTSWVPGVLDSLCTKLNELLHLANAI